MKTIKVNSVEGKTTSKGAKQGRIYKIVSQSKNIKFFHAVTDTGKNITIWNVYGDWSKIGICRDGVRRYSYTSDFVILN